MRFKVLGPLEVEGDDGPVPIVGQRPRALLTALLDAAERGRRHRAARRRRLG